MQQFDSREEREIDLIDLMWRLLMQWKPIICVMLVCGILVAGVMYVKRTRDFQASLEKEEQATEEDLMAEVTQAEYDAVITACNYDVQLKSLQKYLEESLYLQADPYNMRTLSLVYRVDTDDEIAYSVTSMYSSKLGSDAFMKEVAGAMDYDGELKYVRELVSTGMPGIESKSLQFSVNVTLLSDMDAKAIASVIDDYVLKTAFNEISQDRPFRVTKTAESVREIVNTGTTTARMDFDAKVKGIETTITNSLAAFTEPQKALYRKLTEADKDKEEEEESIFKPAEEELEPEKPGLSLKFLLVGLFLGAFMYGGCVMMYAIFRPTIQTTAELNDVYGLYQIDELHRRSFSGGLKGFINDKKIYALRFRKSNKDEEASRKEAATQITGLRERGSIDTVYLAPLGKGFVNGPAAAYADKLKEDLAAAKINVEVLHDGKIKDEILSVPQTAGIVVLANVGDTTYRSLDEICGYARKYGISLLGVVALDM